MYIFALTDMSTPGRIRTYAHELKRLLLWPLSYGGMKLEQIVAGMQAVSGRTSVMGEPVLPS